LGFPVIARSDSDEAISILTIATQSLKGEGVFLTFYEAIKIDPSMKFDYTYKRLYPLAARLRRVMYSCAKVDSTEP
jgi:hypothetical protein